MRTLILTTSIALLAGVGCKSSSTTAPAQSYKQPDAVLDLNEQQVQTRVNADTYFAAGQLSESQGRLDSAVMQYRQAIAADADHVQSLYALARLQTIARRYDQAIPAWERYVQATGQTPNAWNNLAKCYELAEQWADAEASYLRALERDPMHRQTRVNYGLLLARRDRVDEAEKMLGEVMPASVANYNIASVFEIRGMRQEARQRYEQALSYDPNFVEARQRLEMLLQATAD
jgi:tetratricopeptide (TPR) repeat protein